MTLALGNSAALYELLVRVVIPLRELQGSLLLSQFGFGGGDLGVRGGDIGFGLTDASGGIHFGLLGLKIVLLELLLEDGDLVVRHLDARFGPVHGGAGLFFAGADLGVVEGGDDVAGFDGIAFATRISTMRPAVLERRRSRRLRCVR